MSFNRMTENVLNISGLADKPTCTATELKGFFDKAGAAIKNFINAFIDQLEAETAAGNIGANISSVATKKLQAILEEFEKSIADRYTKTELETLVSEETNSLISDFNLDITTGVMTITKKDGTVITYDTALEKVPATFRLIEENEAYYLEIINVDGSSTRINVNNLFNEYLFTNSDEIAFEVTDDGNSKRVIARIKDNSIGKGKISLDLITQLEGYVQSASSSANLASTSANTATQKANEASTSASDAKTSEENAKYYYEHIEELIGTFETDMTNLIEGVGV